MIVHGPLAPVVKRRPSPIIIVIEAGAGAGAEAEAKAGAGALVEERETAMGIVSP